MVLNTHQKQSFLAQYDLLIWKLVHGFERRYSSAMTCMEDLHQECVLVLLRHAQNAANEEQLHQIPIPDMHNAMCRFVLSNQSTKFPVRTSQFNEFISSQHGSVPFESETLDIEDLTASIDDAMDVLSFESFTHQLPPCDQELISLKRSGYTNREITRTIGTSDVKVTRRLKRLCKSFHEYNS